MNRLTINGFRYRKLPGDSEVDLNVAVAGTGPAIVLLHGFPQTHYMWRHVAHELAEQHTVIILTCGGTARAPNRQNRAGRPTRRGQWPETSCA